MKKTKEMRNISTRTLVILAVLSALSAVLMMLDFPLIFLFPGFLKLDFSDLPMLIASFWFGPLSGIAVALVKNLIHLTMSATGGVGELANFIVSAALGGTAGLIYRLKKTKRGAAAALVGGGLVMTLVGIAANYYITIPFFSKLYGLDAIIEMSAKLIPFINTRFDVVLYSITPFNILKSALIGGLTFLLYKRVKGLLK